MGKITAGKWEAFGDTYIRGELVPGGAPIWQGHTHVSWTKAGEFTPQTHIELAQLAPPCEGSAIVTAITSAREVFEGASGVWIDFHGVGPLTIHGEPVEFV